ncbi:hypothetical protein VTK73DRAFT_3166 [Phialemonium thermophilum]|uniref:Uncharacterized protein n=1 Tax=Phialemonium thermophilum TaxID=223376 RepID=A0ABR3X0U7_9PEZI
MLHTVIFTAEHITAARLTHACLNGNNLPPQGQIPPVWKIRKHCCEKTDVNFAAGYIVLKAGFWKKGKWSQDILASPDNDLTTCPPEEQDCPSKASQRRASWSVVEKEGDQLLSFLFSRTNNRISLLVRADSVNLPGLTRGQTGLVWYWNQGMPRRIIDCWQRVIGYRMATMTMNRRR